MMATSTAATASLPPRPNPAVARALSFAGGTPALPPTARAATTAPPAPAAGDSQAIQVVLRVRPVSEAERAAGATVAIAHDPNKPGVVHVTPTNAAIQCASVRRAGRASFNFSTVLDASATQQNLFRLTTLPLVQALFRDRSSVVLAYGQTGSGKTWTIQGDRTDPGVLPCALHHILRAVGKAMGDEAETANAVSDVVAEMTGADQEASPSPFKLSEAAGAEIDAPADCDYDVTASFLEVYNEQIYDLFVCPPKEEVAVETSSNPEEPTEDENPFETRVPATNPPARKKRPLRRKPLKIKAVRGGDIRAEGLREVAVQSLPDVQALLAFGHGNRSVAKTDANAGSSRSHAIFSINLRKTQHVDGKTLVTTSQLAFVDLAGFERTKRTHTTGQRLKEAGQINTSLLNLGQCLAALRDNQRAERAGQTDRKKLVPFRTTKLTRLLQSRLQLGAAVIIVTCSPTRADADETIHTLRRAVVAKEVTVAAAAEPTVSVLRELRAGGGSNGKRVRRIPRPGVVAAGRVGKENVDGAASRALASSARKLVDAERGRAQEASRAKAAEANLTRCRQALEDANDELLEMRAGMTQMQVRYEERLAQLEERVRKEVVAEAYTLIDGLQDMHRRELDEVRCQASAERRKRYELTKTNRKKMAQSIAGRASMAVSNFRYELYSDGEEEEEGEKEDAEESTESSSEEEEEEDEEVVVVESGDEKDAPEEEAPAESAE